MITFSFFLPFLFTACLDVFTAESQQCMTQGICSSCSIFPGPYCCLVAEQVSYYLPGYLPPQQIFVPPARPSDSIIVGAYAEQGLAFEGELQLHCLCAWRRAIYTYMHCQL